MSKYYTLVIFRIDNIQRTCKIVVDPCLICAIFWLFGRVYFIFSNWKFILYNFYIFWGEKRGLIFEPSLSFSQARFKSTHTPDLIIFGVYPISPIAANFVTLFRVVDALNSGLIKIGLEKGGEKVGNTNLHQLKLSLFSAYDVFV